jgi:UDP-arabinose 4-epimerase
MHFAASAYVGESMQPPRAHFKNNVVNSLQLLDVMIDNGAHDIVFSSSCATYGVPDSIPVHENTPQRPINPYGDSKLFVEKALTWYAHAYDLKWVALRYFNAAGADPDLQIGEDHDPETHIIPLVIHAALGKMPHFEIFGTDYDSYDGTSIRDYVHVTDLAEAHVLALRHLSNGGESIGMNLSTGRGYSIREVIAEVEKVSRRNVPLNEAPRRLGDPGILVGAYGRAEKVLGWRAQLSNLETIVSTAWRWHEMKNGAEEVT